MRDAPTYCDDWGCPAHVSCRHAWGRSPEYWAFDEAETRHFGREPGAESCDEYERDDPREYLES